MSLYKKMPRRDYFLYGAIIIIGVILDQISKIIILLQDWPLGYDVPVIDGLLSFTFHLNRGAGFGMLSDHRWVFMVVSTIAIIGFGLYIFLGHSDNKLMGISMAMVTSGGIGNMIDRTFLGEVTDFIRLPFLYYPSISGGELVWRQFPIFNIADCFVTVGAGMLIASLIIALVAEIKKSKREKSEKGGKEK